MVQISVIVPFYNVNPEYLKVCVGSVLLQKNCDWELLLIDDGSTNGAADVCRSFTEKDDRIIYCYQDNQGVSAARNNGLDRARGQYILFLDADDFFSEGLFEKIISRIGRDDLDILFFGYCTAYINREIVRVLDKDFNKIFSGENLSEVLQLAVLKGDPRLGPVEVGTPWGKLIKRSVIEDNSVRYTRGLKKGQDTVFTLELLTHCEKIDYCQFCGYHYRMSESSVSHRFNPEIVPVMEKTLAAYEDFNMRHKKDGRFMMAAAVKYVRVLLGEYMDLYFAHPSNKKTRRVLYTELSELINKEKYKKAISMANKDAGGLYAIELLLLKVNWFSLLIMEKKLLMFIRRFLIRNHG